MFGTFRLSELYEYDSCYNCSINHCTRLRSYQKKNFFDKELEQFGEKPYFWEDFKKFSDHSKPLPDIENDVFFSKVTVFETK